MSTSGVYAGYPLAVIRLGAFDYYSDLPQVSVAAPPGSPPARPRVYRFPPGFLWGAATSSHQVEGDNRWNDWWEYEQAGRLPHASGPACRQYELFEADFDMARSWGHNAHRLSLEWSRVEPADGEWSADAFAHYRRVIDALERRALEPVVTLHHFTNPAWFTRRGGWARRDAPERFARYVERAARELGGAVRYWLTINEPTVYVMEAFILGDWPPCHTRDWPGAWRVMRQLARAHVAAYRAIHAVLPQARVGFAHNAPVIEPCNPRRMADRLVAAARDYVLNVAFFRWIGSRPHATSPANPALDFVGLNYYTRSIVRFGRGLGALVGRVCDDAHHDRGPMSAMGWEVHPRGLLATLRRLSQYGLPLLVTENGVATHDEGLRRRFLRDHIAAAGDALEARVDLVGYLYWSLIDNFEWAHGRAPTFGLAAVDYATQTREARPAAADFARICRENQLTIES
jgi:beta-glucosidase